METKNDHTLLLYESLHRGLLMLYQQGKEQQLCIFLAGMCQGLPRLPAPFIQAFDFPLLHDT